jgi:hypothetical protein
MKTYAPSLTNRLAAASPMPLLPPVMIATLPSSKPILSLLRDVVHLIPARKVQTSLAAAGSIHYPFSPLRDSLQKLFGLYFSLIASLRSFPMAIERLPLASMPLVRLLLARHGNHALLLFGT